MVAESDAYRGDARFWRQKDGTGTPGKTKARADKLRASWPVDTAACAAEAAAASAVVSAARHSRLLENNSLELAA